MILILYTISTSLNAQSLGGCGALPTYLVKGFVIPMRIDSMELGSDPVVLSHQQDVRHG